MSKAKAITVNLIQNKYKISTIFRVLIGLLLALCLVYVYLIGSITFNVLARKSLESTARVLGSNISELELKYLAEANKIDKNYAKSLGFIDIKNNIYVTRLNDRVAIR